MASYLRHVHNVLDSKTIQPILRACFGLTTARWYPALSVSRIVTMWAEKMTSARVPEPLNSAELIVAHSMGKKMIHEVDVSIIPSQDILKNIEQMCSQRLNCRPVPYIIGEWDFFNLTLEMKEPVLIPRPETENLVDHILNNFKNKKTAKGTFFDIGCGTGAIGIYLLKQLPQFKGVAMDISETACELTKRNAARHDVEDRLTVVQGDIFNVSGISKIKRTYDFIVSNPPYVAEHELQDLEEQIYRFEDHLALKGGLDGMDVIRQILSLAAGLLKPSEGQLWLETNLDHPNKICEIIQSNSYLGLNYVHTLADFTGRGRFCQLQSR